MIAKQFDESSEGERRKADALATLEACRAVYVNRGRRVLLAALLVGGTATSDDVRAAMDLPPGIDPVLYGAVPTKLARAGIIRSIGYVKTVRASAHSRIINVWELADCNAALQWLEDNPDRPDPIAKENADPNGPALFD